MLDEHLTFFDLKEEPFNTTANPRYVYLTAMHTAALKKTSFVIDTKNGLAVVFGDTGTGKSSLARMLNYQFLDKGYISVLLTNPKSPTPNLLLRSIIQEFRVPTTRAYNDNLREFKKYMYKETVENGKTLVLIIDEAHTLTRPFFEMLRQLMNYETDEQKLLHLVLFAQEELRPKLKHPDVRNFKSRIAMASSLEKLTVDDLAAMIDFRWRAASGNKEHPFAPEALEVLYTASGGIPREAIILANNALLFAFLSEKKMIDKEIMEGVVNDRIGEIGQIGEPSLPQPKSPKKK